MEAKDYILKYGTGYTAKELSKISGLHTNSINWAARKLGVKLKLHRKHPSIKGSRKTEYKKEYDIYYTMMYRCSVPTFKYYSRYGGRGITVCDRWKESFDNFIADMGKAPTKKHSIDRIDNNKGYFKENCKWSTALEQSHNRVTNRYLDIDGAKLCHSEVCRKYSIPRSTFSGWLAKGLSDKELIKKINIYGK